MTKRQRNSMTNESSGHGGNIPGYLRDGIHLRGGMVVKHVPSQAGQKRDRRLRRTSRKAWREMHGGRTLFLQRSKVPRGHASATPGKQEARMRSQPKRCDVSCADVGEPHPAQTDVKSMCSVLHASQEALRPTRFLTWGSDLATSVFPAKRH